MTLFRGSGVAIVTPFTTNNEVNYTKLAELIEWHIDQGTDAIIVCGTTGESPTLTDEEHKKEVTYEIGIVKDKNTIQRYLIPKVEGVLEFFKYARADRNKLR